LKLRLNLYHIFALVHVLRGIYLDLSGLPKHFLCASALFRMYQYSL